MKLLLSIVLSTSLTGSAAFFAYLAMAFFADKHISANFKYVSLKFCMALFLIPFPFLKHLAFRSITPIPDEGFAKTYRDIPNALHQTSEGFYMVPLSDSHKLLVVIWVSILLLVAFYQFYRFARFKNTVTRYLVEDQVYKSTLDRLKKQMKNQYRIQLYHCEAPISPFTYGINRPTILLTQLVDKDSAEMVLMHELQHIKSHDFFYRIMGMLAVLLHCFNPAVYLLFRELQEIQEMNCDEKLLKGFSSEEKQKYGNMLIDIAAKEQKLCAPAVYFSKNSSAFLKKRIRRIADFSHKKASVMRVLFAAMCLVSAVPVFAYAPRTMDWRDKPFVTKEDLDGVDWVIDSLGKETISIPEDEITFKHTDEYLITDEGVIIEDALKSAPKASCQHTYASVREKHHPRSGKGCTVDTYELQYCTKCRGSKDKVLFTSFTYTACPH